MSAGRNVHAQSSSGVCFEKNISTLSACLRSAGLVLLSTAFGLSLDVHNVEHVSRLRKGRGHPQT